MELALDKKGDQLGIKIETEKNLAFDAANLLLGGVYYVHEATYSRAFCGKARSAELGLYCRGFYGVYLICGH